MNWLRKIFLPWFVMELFRLCIFPGILWALCRYWWLKDTEELTFSDMLWLGLLQFWYKGAGAYFFAVAILLILVVLLRQIVGWIDLSKRKATLWETINKEVDKKLAQRGKELDTQVRERHSEREEALNLYKSDLMNHAERLSNRQNKLQKNESQLRAWQSELHAIRNKEETRKEQCQALRARIQWALDALQEEPSNTGLAARLLKKILGKTEIH